MHSSAEVRAYVRPASEVDAIESVATGRPNTGEDPASAIATARLAGFREGRREGLELGVLEGRTLGQEAAALTVEALSRAAADLDGRWEITAERVEALAVHLALDLAEVIIGRELEIATNPGADALRRAMRFRAEHEPVRARLHPDDAAMITSELAADVSVVPDPTVNRGDALVELGDGLVDASIAAALGRVREALG